MLSTLKRSYWVIVASISVVVSLLLIPTAFASDEKIDTSALDLSAESYSTVDDSFLGPVFKAEDTRSTASVITATPGWELFGTCEWRIDDAGCLTLRPANGGSEGAFPTLSGDQYWRSMFPWNRESDTLSVITSVKIEGAISASNSLNRMFYGLKNLSSIEGLNNLKTSNVEEMAHMFSDCSSLTSLDLSSFDTSNVRGIMDNYDSIIEVGMNSMFSGCSSLTSLDLSSFDTSNTGSMDCMFYGCSSLTSLDLSNFDTSNVGTMSLMFFGCSSLTSLDLSNFNTSNVEQICAMFSGCSSLTSLDLSNFNTSNVVNMDSVFEGCSSLMSIDLSSFNTSKAGLYSWCGGMYSMFSGCSSLTSLDLSSFDTSNVIDMAFMFSGCSSLIYLDLSNFRTSKVIEMRSMFEGCSSLISLDLSSFNTSNVRLQQYAEHVFSGSMASMFRGCSSLKYLDLSSFDTRNVDASNGFFDGAIEWVSIGENFTLQKELPDKTWYNVYGQSFTPSTIPIGVANTYKTKEADYIDPTLEFFEKNLNVVVGCDPIQLHLITMFPGGEVDWTSSDPSVATVDSTGTVYFHSKGCVEISAATGYDVARCSIMVDQEILPITDDSDLNGHLAIWDSDVARLLRGNYLRIVKSDKSQDTVLKRNLLNSIDPGSELLEILDIDIVDADGNVVAWSDPDHVVTVQFEDNYLGEYKDNSIYMGIHYIKSSNEFEHFQGYWYRDVPELSFNVNHFSTYAITAAPIVDDSPVRNNVNATGDPSTNKLAQTGDMLGFGAFAIIELIMIAVGITLIARSQTLRSKER